VTIPGNVTVGLVIVATPAEKPEIDALPLPTNAETDWKVSAEKVFDIPTFACKDFTSDIP
jgi:hypothetical protein